MSDSILEATVRGPFEMVPNALTSLLRRRLQERLVHIGWGCVEIIDSDGSFLLGDPANDGPRVTLTVHDRDFYSYASLGGSVGVGQSYFLGMWDVSDLTDLVRIFVRTRAALHSLDSSWARIGRWLHRKIHARRENSYTGSRANIAAHYDLGNDFFEVMLDPTMMYSCAVFEHPDEDLESAQRRKLDHICRKLDLRPQDHLLEIGTGWGGLAEHAARHFGCRVTTTTISREQYDYACARIEAAGLGDRVTLLFDDYRDLDGEYDKIVSIEMIEAVGHRYVDTYFRKLSELLRPDGLALVQSITIEEQSYLDARDSADFIKRFIFPGGCLPSIASVSASLGRATDMQICHMEDIGLHYARTLARWRDNLNAQRELITAKGYDLTFQRLWDFYLAYCEGGFLERSIGDVQFLIGKAKARFDHVAFGSGPGAVGAWEGAGRG